MRASGSSVYPGTGLFRLLPPIFHSSSLFAHVSPQPHKLQGVSPGSRICNCLSFSFSPNLSLPEFTKNTLGDLQQRQSFYTFLTLRLYSLQVAAYIIAYTTILHNYNTHGNLVNMPTVTDTADSDCRHSPNLRGSSFLKSRQ